MLYCYTTHIQTYNPNGCLLGSVLLSLFHSTAFIFYAVIVVVKTCAVIMSLIDSAVLQVPSMLPDEAFTVIRKSFDARKVLHGMISFLS